MLICFVVIAWSMDGNIKKQKVDINILRIIGLNKFDLIRIYVEEGYVEPYSECDKKIKKIKKRLQ
jgi:ABC-type lipoprotein release transport system permease subunit